MEMGMCDVRQRWAVSGVARDHAGQLQCNVVEVNTIQVKYTTAAAATAAAGATCNIE